MDGSNRLVRNGAANLARGVSAGLAAIILPAVLVRALPAAAYSAWALVLQIATYVAMLDLGLQVGIGRFIARENARNDAERRNHFFFGGAVLLAGCGLMALAVTGALALFLPDLFPKITPSLVPECRIAILLIGGSCALSLPGSAVAALFIGLERYEIPALVLGGGRLVQIAGASITAVATHDIVRISIAYALGNVLIQLAYLFCLAKLGPSVRVGMNQIRRGALGELARYCANLSVWNVSMLLVYGLDAAIVAEVDFRALAPYSICSNLMAVLIGFMGSTFNVLISRASALDGLGEHQAVGRLLIAASKVCTRLLLGLGLAAVLWAPPMFAVWIGRTMGELALPFFWVLLAANGLRLLLAPYSTILMGTGEHKWAVWTTLSEGVANLVASIFLGRQFGAIGVAYGTLVGAVVGIAMALLFTFPRSTRIDCARGAYLSAGLFRPAACYLPLAAAVVCYSRQPSLVTAWLPAAGAVVTGYLMTRLHPIWARVLRGRTSLPRT